MWQITESEMTREYKFSTFADAIAFMVATSLAIEKLDHHPEWSNVYNRVKVKLTTHSAGNKVTEKDRQLSSIMDTLYSKYAVNL